MKHLKHFSLLFTASLVIFSLTSCSTIFDILFGEQEQESQIVTIDESGHDYLVQWNIGNQTVSYSNLFKWSASESERSAVEEAAQSVELPSSAKQTALRDAAAYKIAKQNEDIFSLLAANNSSRASSSITTSVTYENGTSGYDVSDTRTFYLASEGSDGYYDFSKENAVCMAKGDHCYVWFINNNPSEISGTDLTEIRNFKTLAATFDALYEKETAILGTNLYETKCSSDYIDPVSKVNLVVADLYKDAKQTKKDYSGVVGFFYALDLLTNDYIQEQAENYEYLEDYKSNETQVLYLDSYFWYYSEEMLKSTIAHEFNHLLNACQKSVINNKEMSTWYTEMLSLLTEDMFQEYLEISDEGSPRARIPYFDAQYYKGFVYPWLSGSSDDSGAAYANTWLFGAYLVRNFGGVELLHQIATNAYTDFDSIDYALKAMSGTDSKGTYISKLDSNYVYQYFYEVLFNGKDSEMYTVNKKVTYTEDSELVFNAIDLEYNYTDTTGKTTTYTPIAFSSRQSLYPLGFEVNYLGYDLASITITGGSDSISGSIFVSDTKLSVY